MEDLIFESIDADLVCKVVKTMKGSVGPTLIDTECWKQMLCSNIFKTQQNALYDAVARLSKLLCTTITNPNHLQQLLVSRLISLDKCPGVRPIGIGEVLRCIIGKTIMCTLKQDVCNSVDNLQTCGGQQAGVEAVMHAMHNVYNEDNCEAILLVDATNAFNSLNREVALRNGEL